VLAQHDAFVRAALLRFSQDEAEVVCGNSLGGCLALRAAEDEEVPVAGIVPIAPAGLDMPSTIVRGSAMQVTVKPSAIPHW
jgi:alpha-beta hydrolase superfamily lysophospholipase